MSPIPSDDNGEQKPSAATRVLGITELAEAILSELEPRSLLISQRVCKLFHEIFQRSTEFKQRLNLLPSSPDELQLLSVTPKFLVITKSRGFSSFSAFTACKDTAQHSLYNVDFTDIGRLSENPEASWRQMQITSPPLLEINKVSRHWNVYYKEYQRVDREYLSNTGGLKLGNLAESIQKSRPGYESAYFHFEEDGGKHAGCVLVCGAEKDGVAGRGYEQS